MQAGVAIIVIVIAVLVLIAALGDWRRPDAEEGDYKRRTSDPDPVTDAILRKLKSRKSYYREIYLKSDAWKRKRYVVMRRDNWRCVHCGARATQVHHKRYAKRNIGKEPIEWLESVCKSCHERLHG
ncbi:MAG: hypothetical protein JNM88_01350 [Chitinophagaceae bacterium]|nr:hypothetical protein [Chitinophagaceae bacterium]